MQRIENATRKIRNRNARSRRFIGANHGVNEVYEVDGILGNQRARALADGWIFQLVRRDDDGIAMLVLFADALFIARPPPSLAPDLDQFWKIREAVPFYGVVATPLAGLAVVGLVSVV